MSPIHSTCLPRALLVFALLLPSCVKVNPVVLDRKTQLENQILGTFQRLEDDLILASSVRGPRPEPSLSPLQREALDALMTREFYRDDLDALKAKQIIGEGRDGLVQVLTPPAEAAEAKAVQEVVDAENRCRKVILQRVVSSSRELSEKDLPELQRVFYRLNAQTARPGDRVQQEDGSWRVVGDEAPARAAAPAAAKAR